MWTFNLYIEEWSLNNNLVSKIWAMSTTSIHLLQFKIQIHLQKNADL